MRTFIGIDLDQNTREKIDTALKPFKKITTPIKWVKPENWHLTLKFIGEVSEEKKNRIIAVLRETPFEMHPFEINITGFGKFGRGNELNILWAGVQENQLLKDVYLGLEDTLARIDIQRESREFKPHLTIGRNRKPFNFKAYTMLIEQERSLPIASFRAHGFQIFKSVLTPGGPVYNILEEITFPNV